MNIQLKNTTLVLAMVLLLVCFSNVINLAETHELMPAHLETIEDVERIIDLGALIEEHYIVDFPRIAASYDDRDAYTAYLNGVWLAQIRRYDEALEEFSKVRLLLKKTPNAPLEMLMLEKVIEINEIYGNIIQYQTDAMRLRILSAGVEDELYIKALYAIAYAHYHTYNYGVAKSYLEVIEDESRQINYDFGLSRYHYLNGLIEQSSDNYSKALYQFQKAHTYTREADQILGFCYTDLLELKMSILDLENGDSNRALERLDKLLNNGKLKSNYLLRDIYYRLGQAYFGIGDNQSAIKHYESALANDYLVNKRYEVFAYSSDIYIELGFVYATLEDYERAFRYIELSSKAYDDNISAKVISDQISALNTYEIDELQRELELKKKLRVVNEETIEMQAYYLKIGYLLATCLFLAFIFLLWMYYMRTKVQKKLYVETITDHLTKVFNRGHIINVLDESKTIHNCIMMMDVDDFKMINDTFGHVVGDKVLVRIAKVISDNLREEDSVGRYGGEEFLVVLKNTPLENGLKVSERILESIRNIVWEEDIKTTISIGLLQCHEAEADELLAEVDLLMYRAKRLGKDRVVF